MLPTRLGSIAGYRRAFEEGRKRGVAEAQIERQLALRDLFYLLVVVLGRKDINNDWLFARCREVEKEPNGYLDLWARDHRKSSLITFGLTIQDILKNPEQTFGIFSFSRPIAKAFLRWIKREFEANEKLRGLFPDVIWENPQRDAPKWSLAADTPVLTTRGWKSHGSLAVGDQIFGSAGQIVTVTGNSGASLHPRCYRVIFDDCELVASSDHLWPVQRRSNVSIPWRSVPLVSERTESLMRDKAHCRMVATPIISGVEQHLPVDPYVLGLWLGDGTAGTNIISMHRGDEAEMLRQLKDVGYEPYVHRRNDIDNFSMWGLPGLKQQLSDLGCLTQKRVPDLYLMSAADQRLALLQGLMDSDGTCKTGGRHRAAGMCTFSNTNPALADAVRFLAASLGLRPSVLAFDPKPPGKKRVHHVYFVGLKTTPPFRLQRKLAHCKESLVKTARYFRRLEPIDSVQVNCISVDAEDHLYLAGHYLVPTHNSEDDGIIVQRKGNPKEATIEAYGLVDSQPVSKHFGVMIFDDVVTADSVTTPDMIEKVTRAWEASLNLSTSGGKIRYIGTRWHYNDTYKVILDRGAAKERRYPAEVDGVPVLLSAEELAEKRRNMGVYTYSAQMLLDPAADRTQGFKETWLRYYTPSGGDYSRMNKYLLVDAASEKKRSSDYTAAVVIGVADDENYYLLDAVRDRLSLTERGDAVFALHRRWKPKGVGYEQYGLMADIDYLRDRQARENYRFEITKLGGRTAKPDRIRRLVPIFEAERFYLPDVLMKRDYEGKHVDLVQTFLNDEYRAFPVGVHDDLFDAMSRICDEEMRVIWPKGVVKEDRYARPRGRRERGSWMAA